MEQSLLPILYGVEMLGGGVLRHLKYLVGYMDKERFQIHILTSSSNQNLEAVEELRQMGAMVGFIPMNRNLNLFNHIRCLSQIVRYIRKNRIMLVHAHSSVAGVFFRIAASMCRTKSIYTPHCFYFSSCRGWKRSFFRTVESALGRITDAVVVAENEKQLLIDENSSLQRKCRVIHNAIEPNEYQRYERGEMLREFDLPADKIIIGGIGRLAEQKDWPLFLSLGRLILDAQSDNFYFLIAGEGELREQLEALAQELGIFGSIKFLGHIEDISKVYSCTDLFLSTAGWEGLPYTYLEAVHFQIPMIVRYTDCMDSVLDQENSMIFSDSDQLDTVVEKIIHKDYSKNPRFKVDVSFEQFIRKHAELYTCLIFE